MIEAVPENPYGTYASPDELLSCSKKMKIR